MRCVIAVALAAANAEEATTAKPLPEQAEFFETKIRPLFANECFRCHSDEAKKLMANCISIRARGCSRAERRGRRWCRGIRMRVC